MGLSGSETGFNYQLKRDGQNIGSVVAGTGAALSFGNQATVGNYTVEVTSNTTPVCKATMSGNVSVSLKTKPEISAAATPSKVCVGKPVALSVTPTIVNATYTWSGPNGFTSSVQNPAIASATASNNGTYSVIVVADGCADTATVALVVNPAPVASITAPQTFVKTTS